MSILQLQLNNQDLTLNSDKTNLGADSAVGAITITVQSINRFAINQVLVIGQIGAEGTEIVKTHASTSPTGTTITLASALTQAHSRGDAVFIVLFDQYELSHATVSGGSKTLLTTTLTNGLVAIDPESLNTLYNESEYSSGGYYMRKKNSITANFSSYSDYIPYGGLGDNTILSVKNRALEQLGETRNDLITDSKLNNAIYEGRRIVDQDPRILRWTFRTAFDSIIGQCVSGAYSVASPTDLRDQNTYKNILGLRIGRQFRPVMYQDKVRFQQNYLNVAHSTTNGAVTVGATSIVLASTADFDNSGSITVGGSGIGTLRAAFAYTGNNRSTNTLTGVTGVPAAGFATAKDCWQNANYGLPSAYTIDNGLIKFDVPFGDDLDGRNITMDYYKMLPTITTDSQTFDEPFWDLYVYFLKYKIKYLKANGKIDRDSDSDYKDWMEGIGRIIAQETNGQKIHMIPDVEGFLSASM